MPDAASAHAWAEKHGVVLSATRYTGETWRLEAKTHLGAIEDEITTDGSYEPDPFECLFGVWADFTPGHHEYRAAAAALGPAALADLARLLGWLS